MLGPVVDAAAPGCDVHAVHDFCSLLTEDRLLLPHPGRRVAVHLNKGQCHEIANLQEGSGSTV
jgi:hypothetical protein